MENWNDNTKTEFSSNVKDVNKKCVDIKNKIFEEYLEYEMLEIFLSQKNPPQKTKPVTSFLNHFYI